MKHDNKDKYATKKILYLTTSFSSPYSLSKPLVKVSIKNVENEEKTEVKKKEQK